MSKSILITGASAGIGAALAREFARRRWSVAIAARRTDRLQALAAELQREGAASVLVVELDVGNPEAVPAAVNRVREHFGRLDVVVANAGVGLATPVGRGCMDAVLQTVQTNVVGAIATIEAAVPIFREQGEGQVVGITSVAGWRGMPNLSAYSASKAALHRYLQALRLEVYGEGIAVTELVPGYIDTDMNRDMPARPFLIPLERGAAIMARMIERRVGYRTVPVMPWSLLAPLLSILPAALLAPRRKARARKPRAGR